MSDTHVIIGAGQAGAWAAMAMRQAGFAGRILLIGEELWRPYERPPLSKAMLTQDPEPPVSFFHKEQSYAERGIELVLGTRVEGIEPQAHQVQFADGRRLSYERLLLTTGGRARRLAVAGGEHVHLLRTLDDARALRARLLRAQRVICIGAGVIGLEIASSARARGCTVTVLEATPRAMGRCVSAEVAGFLVRRHRAAGAELHFNVTIEAIERASDGTHHVLCGEGERFAADLVVAGIGMERNLALAEQAGLVIDGGIVVDETGRASEPEIFAAGDVAAFLHPFYGSHVCLESWRHAQNHGLAVGRSMCGSVTPYDDIPWFWTEQHDINLQVAGLPWQAARTVVRVEKPPAFVAVHLAADDAVVGVSAANAPREIRAGTALIRARCRVDPLLLSDPAMPLQRFLG
jgi:3-phenylpropionate/trans-cinnamate dioxygenase ferredoxin reductase component